MILSNSGSPKSGDRRMLDGVPVAETLRRTRPLLTRMRREPSSPYRRTAAEGQQRIQMGRDAQGAREDPVDRHCQGGHPTRYCRMRQYRTGSRRICPAA